ncbi:MAG: hypothetical protein BZ138_01095 [Methanosphaera sp. rholeuAM270]|nr:MAG: hypothetical protein BZ138_01095 [Methanosphaera sp. rholeuAM270]
MYGIRNFFRDNRLLGVLSIIMVVYSSILVYSQSIRGIGYWDIFVYLQNAMLFANINIGSQLSVPPVFSLLVSIPFRLGFISELSMFVVAGILFIFLVIGIFKLFNECFDGMVSFIGSLIFSMFSLIVTWAVTGATDVPALCFGVWALYFTVLGLRSNFNYYYLAVLFFVAAFFTRFTEGFILLVMGFYLLMNFDEFKEGLTRERCFKLLLFALILVGVICGAYLINQGRIPFISQFLEVSSSGQVSSINVGYDLNPWYYLQNLPQYLTSTGVSDEYFTGLSTSFNEANFLSYVLLLLVIVYLVKFLSGIVRYDKSDVDYWIVKVAALVILSLICIISYTHISYIITEILFCIILLLYYRWLPDNDNKFDYLMFLWIGIFIILHSYHPVKVDRYIIPILVPITYFICKSTTTILKEKKKATIALTIILLILIPINASYITSITQEPIHTHEEKQAGTFLQEYDKNYREYNISSDRGVAYSWYLKKYTYTTIPRVLKANNESLEDKLKSINAKYYIDSTSNTTDIKGYHTIYSNNNENVKIKIYERD